MSQIKLIATDLDGTLLNADEKVPSLFFEQIDQLMSQGIKVAIASGRQYYNIKSLFEHHTKDLYYISDNGALCYHHDQLFHSSFLSWKDAFELVERGKKIPGVVPLISAEHNTFFEKGNDEAVTFIRQYYKQCVVVELFSNIDTTQERPLKVAYYDLLGIRNNCLKHIKKDFAGIIHTPSNVNWLDIAPQCSNKGEALKTLQQKLNISPDETMVFGDFHNDIEMLKKAKYSFAIGSAQDDVKATASYICDTNVNLGVTKVLNDILQNNAALDIDDLLKKYCK